MYGGAYFGKPYFGRSYWGPGTGVVPPAFQPHGVIRGRGKMRLRQPWPDFQVVPSAPAPDKKPDAVFPTIEVDRSERAQIIADHTGERVSKLRRLIQGARGEAEIAEARKLLEDIRSEVAAAESTASDMAAEVDAQVRSIRSTRGKRDDKALADSMGELIAERTAYLYAQARYTGLMTLIKQVEDEIEDEETISMLVHAMEFYR